MPPVQTRDLVDGLTERRYLFVEHRLEASGGTPMLTHPGDYRSFLVIGGAVLLEHQDRLGRVRSRVCQRLQGWHAVPASVYRFENATAEPATVLEAGSVTGGTGEAGAAAECLELSGYRVNKPWGYEIWYTENLPERRYALKQIHMTAGHRSSLQSHRHKAETNYVIEGSATVLNGAPAPDDPDTGIDVAALPAAVHAAGTGWSSAPNVLHRVIADSAYTSIEVSTPELDDVIRWADDTGRSHGRITSEHAGGGA
ncbi:hypothetical protein ACWDA3_22870 [Nonomuraea rubra]